MHTRWRSTFALLLIAATTACATGGEAMLQRIDDGPDPLRVGPQGNLAQFVVECDVSHYAYDDPIVHPFHAGLSHLHQFFGNADVGSVPDYDAVIGAETSCEQAKDTASYWAPALLAADGKRIDSLGLTAYYRPGSGIDPASVDPYPAGLMIVGGDAQADEPQPTDVVAWSCGTGPTRDAVPPACPAGSSLRMLVKFPDCWDGDDLDGDGGVGHMEYSDGGCPESHPTPLPQLLIAIDYPPVDPNGLSLASGSILTGHADFWNVWDQAKLADEVSLCINRDLVCGVSTGRSARP
ncbi:MAG TPA: DUF1996 domain-containing protein [Ilumatobacteraceae bacterium]|nr:DUF1996 domain-containing protein [Ilumatobacteraceae bacterium]